MGKAGKKLLAGAREALAITRGEKMPAKATLHGWALWYPTRGLDGTVFTRRPRPDPIQKKMGCRAVRVVLTTVPNGSRG